MCHRGIERERERERGRDTETDKTGRQRGRDRLDLMKKYRNSSRWYARMGEWLGDHTFSVLRPPPRPPKGGGGGGREGLESYACMPLPILPAKAQYSISRQGI